jgi:PKD repeat protein
MRRNVYLLITCIMLTIFHGCGEEDYPVPPASTVAKFTVALDNKEFAPATATFSNGSVIPDRAGEVTYYWNFGDGTSSTEKEPVHFYEKPGAYTTSLVIVTGSSNEMVETETRILVKDPNADGVPIYFTNQSTVYTALINEQAPLEAPIGITMDEGYSVVLDTVHDKLYIPDLGKDIIIVANMDGTDAKTFRSGIGTPTSAVIDYKNNRLYWDTNNGIRYTSLDDDNIGAYTDFVTGQSDPEGIAIDTVNKRLYWNTYSGGVWSKNLNGTDEKLIITGLGGTSMLVVGDRIYYDTRDAGGISAVEIAKLDGTKVGTITSGMSRRIYGLAYDGDANKLYWADRGATKIMRANLDGTEAEVWFTGMSVYGLAIGKKK